MISLKDITFLFDMDGVVANTESQYDLFFDSIQGDYNLGEDFNQQIRGKRLEDILNITLAHLSDKEKEEIGEITVNFELNKMEFPFVSGVREFMQEAKEAGIQIGLVTSSLKCKTTVALRKMNLENFFDCVITADDIKNGKPEPDCYAKAMQILNAIPHKTVVFEDAFAGLEAAKSANAYRTVGVATANPRDELKKCSDLVIDDFQNIKINDILNLLNS